MKHDNLGRASVKSESGFAEFASAALAKLKEMPEKLRSFFGDPALRYIRYLEDYLKVPILIAAAASYAIIIK